MRISCTREAQRLLRNPTDAEDAAQEALTRAWRSRDRCLTPERPLPWLMRITYNESMRLLADRRRLEARADDEFALYALPAPADDGDRLTLAVDVDRALEGLPEDDRRLLHLHYREDLAGTEIAHLLGAPDSTIRVRLHRLRHRLRRELTKLR
jgi:RNA polymerase sigma-70 factor (ECF subfamily)